MELSHDEVELRELFDELARKWRPAIIENGNELRVLAPAADAEIVCDAHKLRRVIENLLSNAAKFTKKGLVTFSASTRDDLLVVSVEDTGMGIAENQISRLFETFGNSEDETASNYGDDVRLGLPLAQRYCRLMGGELSVKSQLGFGSRFDIQLPIRNLSNERDRHPQTELAMQAA